MSRGCLDSILPSSYAWGNFAVLAVGVWAIAQRDSVDAVVMVGLCFGSSCRNMQTASCETSLAADGAIGPRAPVGG